MIAALVCCLALTQDPQPVPPLPPTPVQAPAANPPEVLPAGATEPQKFIPETSKAPRVAITAVGDNGLLEHDYFGAVLPFTPRGGVDAFWLKDGLSLKGKRITYGVWEAKVLKPGRQERHLQRAADLARVIPDALMPELRAAFQGVAEWELGGTGDYRFEARVVDANIPNTASKLMFGWLAGKDNLENVTWDMKLVDTKTGEVAMAFHHRMVKVNTLGSLDSSLRDWARSFPKKLLDYTR